MSHSIFPSPFPTTRGFLEADSDTQQASISAHPIDVRWDSGPETVAAMPTHTYPSPVSISWLFLRCVSGRCLVERSWHLSPSHNIPSFAPAHLPISCSTAPHRVLDGPALVLLCEHQSLLLISHRYGWLLHLVFRLQSVCLQHILHCLSTDMDVEALLQPFGGLFGRITVTRGNCSHEVSLDNLGKFGWSTSLAAWPLHFAPFGNDMGC